MRQWNHSRTTGITASTCRGCEEDEPAYTTVRDLLEKGYSPMEIASPFSPASPARAQLHVRLDSARAR
jgi:hypothetical protein